MKYIALLLLFPVFAIGQTTNPLVNKTTGQFVSPTSTLVKKGNSISTSPVDANFVFEGDSLTLGNNNTAGQEYPTIFAALSPVAEFARTMSNVATSGNDLDDIVSQYASQVYPLRPAASGRPTYLVVWIGANDLAGGAVTAAGGAAAWTTDLTDYLQTAKDDGFTTIVFTILPINNAEGYDADRTTINRLLIESSIPDFVFQVDQAFPTPSNTTWYNADGLHLTDAANAVLAERLLSSIISQDRGRKQMLSWLSQGRLGVDNPNPKGALDTLGAWSMIGGDSLLDNTTKTFRVGARHYDIDEEPVTPFTSNSSSSANQLSIGGGTASGNSITQGLFYSAANTTTTTGTVVGEFGLTYWVLGSMNEGSNAILTVNGTRPMIRLSTDSSNAQANTGFVGVNGIGAGSYTTNSALNDLILTAPASGRVLFGTSAAGTQVARGWFTAAGNFVAVGTITAGSGSTELVNATGTLRGAALDTNLGTQLTTVGNVGAGEDTLWTQAIAANTLSVNGHAIHATLCGVIETGSTPTLRIKFGATELLGVAPTVSAGDRDWSADVWIVRTGAATQRAIVTLNIDGDVDIVVDETSPAETLSGSVNFAVTGEGTSDNDITLFLGKASFVP